MALGSCAEVICFRKYLDILVDSISGEGYKELEIDNSTMETFRNIEITLKAISQSQLAYTASKYKLAKGAIDLVVNKYANLMKHFLSPDEFEKKKVVDRSVKIAKEKEKNKTQKLYPAA